MHTEKAAHILLIEDNPGDIGLIKEQFQVLHSGACFTIANDGEEAIEMLDKLAEDLLSLPDLIILDLNLPKKDGKEVLTHLKQHHELKVVPVVVFSSSASESDIIDSYQKHANCYVVKPFDFDSFNEAIRTIWQFWFKTSNLPRHN